jgi:hypothetical protein
MLGWTTGPTEPAFPQRYCSTRRRCKKNNPQTRSAIRNPQRVTSRNQRTYFLCTTAELAPDLDLILKTTAVAGNSNFISDSRATAAHLIHCEGNFRLKSKQGTFFLPATLLSHFPCNFLTGSLGVCRHHRAISKFQKRVSNNSQAYHYFTESTA